MNKKFKNGQKIKLISAGSQLEKELITNNHVNFIIKRIDATHNYIVAEDAWGAWYIHPESLEESMAKKFTDKELQLARCFMHNANNLEQFIDSTKQCITSSKPTWWAEAIAEADLNLVWVEYIGWLKKEVLDALLEEHGSMEALKKELEKDEW